VTEQEKKLWRFLQAGQIGGVSFRRQHPLGDCVLDFYAPSLRLAVECDGGQHGRPGGGVRDEVRTAWLKRQGVVVLRYWNGDIDANIEGVVADITGAVARFKRPPPNLPLSGGGIKTK
jgi:very-short-patch-repair endonuclease